MGELSETDDSAVELQGQEGESLGGGRRELDLPCTCINTCRYI